MRLTALMEVRLGDQDRMAKALAENPGLGRHGLARAAGTTENKARAFLERQKNPHTAPPPTPTKDPHDFLKLLSPSEIALLEKSIKATPTKHEPQAHTWAKDSFKFAAIADTHIGHRLAHIEWWEKTCDLIAREKCDFVLHAGDITEGMSGRPGHYHELAQIGTGAQVREAVSRLGMLPCTVKAITGNHDCWSFKSTGADPGEMIAASLDKFEYLGMDEADVTVQGVTIKLWHGGDGSSYATSYRTQKFVEGLTGGEKPHILISGHAHKSIFHMCRNIAVFEGGTLCGQTGWMRGKKLSAHCGFWIIEVWPAAGGGIERLTQQWVPLFKG